MKQKTSARLAALLLAFALLLTSCGSGTAAATMRLRKTEGTVGVSDGEGRDVAVADDLGLYSGYQVGTQAESYAWIDLDSVKLTKMDADSEVEVVKDGKKLELNIKSGSLFFNVTQPLADDETMDIRTSTMVVGIRGTCGWVAEDSVALLKGAVSVAAGEQEVTVSAGEMAVLTEEGTLEVRPLTAGDVPAFVRPEVGEDDLPPEESEAPAESGAPDAVDPIYRRDLYTYSRALNYYPDGTLYLEIKYFPDEQGRIGRNVHQYLDRDLSYEWIYIYNDEGTLSRVERADGTVTSIVTENTADHQKRVSNSGSETIYYYDEQGRMIRKESTEGYYNVYTYEGEKLIRYDNYQADGSLYSYTLYEYD